MKKYIICLLVLLFPFTVSAKTYNVEDLKIDIDDTKWYVFTRENILNNEKLEELNVSYDYISNAMNENDVYLDSLLVSEDSDDNIELFIVKKSIDGDIRNLHTYPDSEINELGEELIKTFSVDSYKVYKNDYAYIELEEKDSGYNILKYYTVINGYGYTIMAQKVNEFSQIEKNEIKDILNTVIFNLDQKYEAGIDFNIGTIIIGVTVGIIVGGLCIAMNRKKSKTDI